MPTNVLTSAPDKLSTPVRRVSVIRTSTTFWVAVAAILTLVYWMAIFNDRFETEPHAWATAHVALLARSFNQFGILHLHGVPIQNNPPLGLQPDRYIHWPPLYPIVLSLAFRTFGESEGVVHGLAMLVTVAYLLAFWHLVRYCFDPEVAMLSMFGLLTLPTFGQYATLGWTPNSVMGAACGALYCFLRGTETRLDWKWVSAGAGILAAGICCLWEAAPLGFVLLGAAFFARSRTRRTAAAVYAAVSLITVATVLALLVSSSPELRDDLWATVRYRMGQPYHAIRIPLHAMADAAISTRHLALGPWILNLIDVWGRLLGGALGLVASTGVVFWTWENRSNRPNAFFAVGGLLGLVLVWILLFPNHVFIHDYETLIAAPLFAVGLGFVLQLGSDRLPGPLRWLTVLVVPLILIVPLSRHTLQGFVKPDSAGLLAYARDIEEATSASAVVLSPIDSMVPVYYSHRHLIRSVVDDGALKLVIGQAEAVFPGNDIYLAIPRYFESHFPCASSRFPLVKSTRDLLLLRAISGVCD
jgi:4-amino-4-deoxy-L-arabinose transferase-like glycosyltransferase